MAIQEITVSKIYILATEPTKKVKDRFWFDTANNILKRYDSDSCITFDFNNEVMSVDLISQKTSLTLEFKRIKLNKTDKLFEVEYVVDNTNKIYYRVEIINL